MNNYTLELYNIDNFNIINNEDLLEVNGGLIITGTAVLAGIGTLSGGVAVGYGVGKILRKIF